MNGQVYTLDTSLHPIRFALDQVNVDNKSIHYISPGYNAHEPYGCGYAMKREELEDDKFALKVLAQDQDYDLCLIDSSRSMSYNLRKNGGFYPLNEVKGINEYLDKCFPYVKEAATNQEGDIWMLPIGVDIPGLVVNEQEAEKLQVELKNNMTYEEYTHLIQGMTPEEIARTSCNYYVVSDHFFEQYFHAYTSLNQENFRRNITLLQQLKQTMPMSICDLTNMEGLSLSYKDDFIYKYSAGENDYQIDDQLSKGMDDISVYSMPKFSSSDKNVGSCVFLAVNPNSKNLKQTLDYIEDLIIYQQNLENTPTYFQRVEPTGDHFLDSLYELYENGEIAFQIENDLYSEGLDDVIDQKMEIETYITNTDQKLDTYFNE